MIINKNHKLHKVCSKEAYRPALTGVYFDKKNSRLIATNGHVLAMSPIEPDKYDKECIMPAKAYLEECKGTGTSVLKLGKKIELIAKTGEKLQFDPIEETYPDYERSMPQEEKTVFKLRINARLLKDLSEALGNEDVSLHFTNTNMTNGGDYLACGNSAIKVTAANEDSSGILMPIRNI